MCSLTIRHVAHSHARDPAVINVFLTNPLDPSPTLMLLLHYYVTLHKHITTHYITNTLLLYIKHYTQLLFLLKVVEVF